MPNSSSDPLEAVGVVPLISGQRHITSHTVSAATFFFWDYCLTLSHELELIWTPKWNFVSILFYLSRYLTFFAITLELIYCSDAAHLLKHGAYDCMTWLWLQSIAEYLLYNTVELLLLIRVYAFYNKRKSLFAFLSILFVAKHAVTIYIFVVSGSHVIPLPVSLGTGRCLLLSVNKVFVNYWIPSLVLEGVLFILLIARYFQLKKETKMAGYRLLDVFVRDGAWGFATATISLTWCAVVMYINPLKANMTTSWIFAFFSVCASRMVLNLRMIAKKRTMTPSHLGQVDTLCPHLTSDSLRSPFKEDEKYQLKSSPIAQEQSAYT